jgi:hypothetical protein
VVRLLRGGRGSSGGNVTVSRQLPARVFVGESESAAPTFAPARLNRAVRSPTIRNPRAILLMVIDVLLSMDE